MPADETISPERREILMLRARILALEEAMRLVAGVTFATLGPHLAGAIGTIREGFEARLADDGFARSLPEAERAEFKAKSQLAVDMILETFEDLSAQSASAPVGDAG